MKTEIQLTAECEALWARVRLMERALEKVGLHQCGFSGDWFKMPEEGIMLPALGKPASWDGVARMAADGKIGPSLAGTICGILWGLHRTTIEGVLRDSLARPCGVSKVAVALGLKYPLKDSVGLFGQWLKANGQLR